LPDALDLVVLAVRAGHLPVAALRAVHPHFASPLRDATARMLHEVDRGRRFADALPLLSTELGSALDALVDGLAAAERDGLPLAPVLERLAADARAHRRRHLDTLARQLPVRLAVPLVVCILPSFVLLAVVPLLLAALSSLHR
jgi:tight adherence protein C